MGSSRQLLGSFRLPNKPHFLIYWIKTFLTIKLMPSYKKNG